MPRPTALHAERLEVRVNPAPLVATADAGTVTLADSVTGTSLRTIVPFPDFDGDIRVALADFTRDGTPDLVAGAGPGGGPLVAVFDGATGSPLRSLVAFDPAFRGGISVGAGDVNNDGVADILVGAGPGGGPHVKVFDGDSGEELRSFFAYEPTFTGGVTVAAGDFRFDGSADIVVGAGGGGGPRVEVFDARDNASLGAFFAYEPTFRGGVNVAAADLDADGAVELITGAGRGGGPLVRVFGGVGVTTNANFFAGDSLERGGVRVAASDLDGDKRDDILAAAGDSLSGYSGISLEPIRDSAATGAVAGSLSRGAGTDPAINNDRINTISDIERLGVYNRASGSYDPVTADTIPDGAHVYVMAHGWAPGYLDWVNAYAQDTGGVLKWWQTNPTDASYAGAQNVDDLGPAGAFMFDGTTDVSAQGFAETITGLDADAVVLAFSWIDQSATSDIFGVIPFDANVSEAYTAVNGLRLASAVGAVLPADFAGGGGTLHVLGHSHGSKVATTGAVALQRAGFAPTQLSTLDSPEAGTLTELDGAVNFNWYFLQDLNTSRDGGTLVDNYISEFGNRYSNIDSPNVANVVDVELDPLLDSELDFSARHEYAPAFYVGTSAVGGDGGIAFDPATAGTLAADYTQAWREFPRDADEQFVLDTAEAFPPTPSVFPTFDTVDFLASESEGDVDFNEAGETVTLSGASASWVGYFDPAEGSVGMTFEYEFLTDARGQLSVSVNGYLAFVVDEAAAAQLPQRGTISVPSLTGDPLCNRFFPAETCQSITLALTGASGASVQVNQVRTLTI